MFNHSAVAVNGSTQSCDRFHKLKCSVSLGCSFDNEIYCGCPGGCRGKVACYLPMTAANVLYIDVCEYSPIRLPNMQDQKSLTLHSQSFSDWGRECVTISFAYKGSRYVIYERLHPIATRITQGARPKIMDMPLTVIFRMGQGAVLACFWS